jgi:signal transduction histidine kinase
MKSLQLRLAVGLFISLFSVFIILWYLTSSSIRYLAEESVAEHLEHDAMSILAAISVDANNNLLLDLNRVEPIYLEPFSGDYYQIITPHQVITSRSLMNQKFAIPVLEVRQTRKLYLSGPHQQPLIVMVYGYSKQKQNITIALAEDLSRTFSRIAVFQHRYGVISVALLLLLITVQATILRASFYPLRRIQKQVKALEGGEITQLDTDVPTEVAELVGQINWLLNILEQRLQRSRNALSDLAHALKTPLTVLQQLSREHVLASQPEVSQTLQNQTENMQRIMERVLRRARLAGAGPTTFKFDVHNEIPPLILVLQKIYRDKQLAIDFFAAETAFILIDREDMLELTGNLLDNACKWAKSRVSITFDINEKNHLIIEDDGPGVSDEDMAKLTQRGSRLDESVHGHGLGLSIAQLIAKQHNGDFLLCRSNKLGGFCVEVVFHKIDHHYSS